MPDLSVIPLRSITEQIPAALRKYFQKLELETLEDAMALTPALLRTLLDVGEKEARALVAFQRDVRENHKKYGYEKERKTDAVPAVKWYPENYTAVDRKAGHILLRSIASLLTAPQVRICNRMRLETIHDVLHVDQEAVRALSAEQDDAIRCLRDLVVAVKASPEKFLHEAALHRPAGPDASPAESASPAFIPPPFSRTLPEFVIPGDPLLLTFQQFEGAYHAFRVSTCVQSGDHPDILRSVHAIGGDVITDRVMALRLGITDAELRKIQELQRRMMVQVLEGTVVLAQRTGCHPALTAQFDALRDRLAGRTFVTHAHACGLAGVSPETVHARGMAGVLHLLYSLMGFGRMHPEGGAMFCRRGVVTVQHMSRLHAAVRSVMKRRNLPVEAADIIDDVNEAMKHGSVALPLVDNVLDELPEYELIEYEGRDCYQLRFAQLGDLRLMAIRILAEHGEPMTANAVATSLNRRLEEEDLDGHVRRDEIPDLLAKSHRAIQYARTGRWGLREWA